MDRNITPSSRRNRSSSSGTPQQNPNLGFQQFQQGYQPQIGFQPFHGGYQPQMDPNQFQQLQQQFTREAMLQRGYQPANFNLPPPASFESLSPANFPLPSPGTWRSQNVSTSEEEDEYVPETQQPQPQPIPTPETIPNANTSGKQKRFGKRATRQTWTRAEEVALAKAWIDVSEDAVVGNSQTGDSFWVRVENMFYSIVGRVGYRTRHQLNTKFKDLNKKVTRFAGIYNNLVNTRPSGASEADILKTAHARYQQEVGTAFIHGDAWEILKESPKWNQVPTMSSASSRASKRSKTSGSSDAGCNFNVVDDDEDDDEDEPIQRPIGRNKAKRALKSTAAEPDPNFLTSVSEFSTRVDEKKEYRLRKLALEQEKLDIKKKELELQTHLTFEKDFEFYISPHDHLTGVELAYTLAKKERIKKFHNFDF